jgi:hypothetical protein
MQIVLAAQDVATANVSLIHYAVVCGLGGLVGAGELVARYRDAPAKALQAAAAMFYVGMNVAAAASALALARVFGWKFGVTSEGDALVWTQVLVSGLAAMALFRSSLFLVHVGNQDVGVGPSGFLQVMLKAADTGVDRHRATSRAKLVGKVMARVSFAKAIKVLPSFCLGLMQNVSVEDQERLAAQIAALVPGTEVSDSAKALVMGLSLLNVVGEEVLQQAVQSLGSQIEADP